jgi:hypothetical protein
VHEQPHWRGLRGRGRGRGGERGEEREGERERERGKETKDVSKRKHVRMTIMREDIMREVEGNIER